MKLHRSVTAGSRRAALIAFALAAALAVTLVGSASASAAFAPTIKFETSTSRATAHPDARITIDNSASDVNIKDLTLSLPDGFWGSMAAVLDKCHQADAEAGDCGTATPESAIGTVTATATITDPQSGTVVNGVLTGDVFLTDAFVGNNDPAGVSIVVDAKVGGVDLGRVVINGRAVARMAAIPGAPSSAAKDIKGLDTIVEDIPQEIVDTANTPNRTVSYKVEKMQIDLISKLQDPNSGSWDGTQPLLTNPSRCGSYIVSATATPYGGGADATFTDDYTVDQCDTTHFDPDIYTMMSNDPLPPGAAEGLYSFLWFNSPFNGQPEGNASFQNMKLKLPRGFGANFSALVGDDFRCPGSALVNVASRSIFKPSDCAGAPYANVGFAVVMTPLLPTPLVGDILVVNTTPVPSIVIAVTDDIPGNVPGINLHLVGQADLINSNVGASGDQRIEMEFKGLPDTPVSYIEIYMDEPDRGPSGSKITSKLLQFADDNTYNCQKTVDLSVAAQSSAGASRAMIQPFDTSCSGPTTFEDSGPWGQITEEATPTFDFTYTGAAAELFCGVDSVADGGTPCKASSSFTPSSPVSPGLHSMIVGDGPLAPHLGNKGTIRDFAVEQTPNPDLTVPDTELTAGPGADGTTEATADSRPTFSFKADQDSVFQCSLDGGAFLPCGSADAGETASHKLSADEAIDAYIAPGESGEHTFAVRAQNAAGNVDLSPATATFKIVKPFAPTMGVGLSTWQSRGNPMMSVVIDNLSNTHVKDLYLNMPDGFFGGITGVQLLCPVANADAGTCPAGSQVGTVETTAVIDRSTATISGRVFLTDPRIPGIGEPAGLMIEVTPKIQDVEFIPVRINARLSVRGEARGINTATLSIPDTATTTVGEVSTFDLRRIVLQLGNNPLAPRPLLTNPSYCGVGMFYAGFFPNDAGAGVPAAQGIPFSGCQALNFAPGIGMNFTDHKTGRPPTAYTATNDVSADLEATVGADPNGAGIRNTEILMPKGVTINVRKIPFVCQMHEYPDNCPASSLIGSVSAVSPLLPEVLTGNVYMLRGDSLPRLFLRLRGRINVNLIADNRFVNVGPRKTQMVTTFTDLPDVPLSWFNMRINEFLTTRDYACEFGQNEWNATSTMVGWNGSVATGVHPLQFGCPNLRSPIFSFKTKWKPRRSKSTLALGVTPKAGTTTAKATVKLPRRVRFVKRAFTKKRINRSVVVRADGRRLSRKCFKLRRTNTFEVNLCRRKVHDLEISFRRGSITTKSRSKRIKLNVTTVDNKRKKQRVR